MKHSAGILLSMVIDGYTKYLVCHPTGASWMNTFSIPKGEYLPEEELSWKAAIRETREETGVIIFPEDITNKEYPVWIPYKSKRAGNTYKEVLVYKSYFFSRQVPGLKSDLTIDKQYLQLEEVDWAGFLAPWELFDKIFWRFKSLVMNIDHLYDKKLKKSILVDIEKDGKDYLAYTLPGSKLFLHYLNSSPESAYKGLIHEIEELYNDLKKTEDKSLSEEFINIKNYIKCILGD